MQTLFFPCQDEGVNFASLVFPLPAGGVLANREDRVKFPAEILVPKSKGLFQVNLNNPFVFVTVASQLSPDPLCLRNGRDEFPAPVMRLISAC